MELFCRVIISGKKEEKILLITVFFVIIVDKIRLSTGRTFYLKEKNNPFLLNKWKFNEITITHLILFVIGTEKS